jgi:hypothetical protein
MCSINKVDQPAGNTIRHRFSCPLCGERTSIRRRRTSLGRKVKTLLACCLTTRRVYVPKYVYSPSAQHEPQGSVATSAA